MLVSVVNLDSHLNALKSSINNLENPNAGNMYIYRENFKS